jgi:putative GTP pyrophosphokinase
MTDFTKSQIDRLGERLKKYDITVEDRHLLDKYRRSFSSVYEKVIEVLRTDLALEPTGRPSKSTISIIDKLRRESIRLSQMQDIAGCRVIVSDINEQEGTVDTIKSMFEKVGVVDRRQKPSHGYRAVHIIANIDGKLIEIQVRTRLQHLWAENVEKTSDFFGMGLKYGTGSKELLSNFSAFSKQIFVCENLETKIAVVEKLKAKKTLSLSVDEQATYEKGLQLQADMKKTLEDGLKDLIELLKSFT